MGLVDFLLSSAQSWKLTLHVIVQQSKNIIGLEYFGQQLMDVMNVNQLQQLP